MSIERKTKILNHRALDGKKQSTKQQQQEEK
jgi:hypothetical protein